MNAINLPLSNLQRERKDSNCLALRAAVEAVIGDPDNRWTDAEMLVVHLSTQDLKKFLMNLGKREE